jgi:hypothetical protein
MSAKKLKYFSFVVCRLLALAISYRTVFNSAATDTFCSYFIGKSVI